MNEPILQIVGDVYLKKGFLKKDTYRLVFTEDDVLFSHLTKEVRKEEQKQLTEDLKGKSFKERVGEMFHMNKKVYEKYEQMSVDEILSMGTDSFRLPYKDIKKVKRHMDFDSDSTQRASKVTITTNSDKLKLSFSDDRASSKTYKIIKEKIK